MDWVRYVFHVKHRPKRGSWVFCERIRPQLTFVMLHLHPQPSFVLGIVVFDEWA